MDDPTPPEGRISPPTNVVQLPRAPRDPFEEIEDRIEGITSRLEAQESVVRAEEAARQAEQIRDELLHHQRRLKRHRTSLHRARPHEVVRARRDAARAQAEVQRYQILLAQAQSRASSSWSWGKVVAVLVVVGVVAWSVYRLARWIVNEVRESRAALPPEQHFHDERYVDQRSFPTYDQRTINRPERVIERERVRVERVPERTIVEKKTIVKPTEVRTEVHEVERRVERTIEKRPVVHRKTIVKPTKHTHTREVRQAPATKRTQKPSRDQGLDQQLARLRKAAKRCP